VVPQIRENYADFVTPALPERWTNDPESAPGRTVSSPWPKRIEPASTERLSETAYAVKGSLIYITSSEVESGGSAATRPVTLKLVKDGTDWRIGDIGFGKYADSRGMNDDRQNALNAALPEAILARDGDAYAHVPDAYQTESHITLITVHDGDRVTVFAVVRDAQMHFGISDFTEGFPSSSRSKSRRAPNRIGRRTSPSLTTLTARYRFRRSPSGTRRSMSTFPAATPCRSSRATARGIRPALRLMSR
jgi:hypothetical protein